MYRILSVAAALVLAAAATAQAEVKLERKIAEETEFTKTVVNKTHQVLTIGEAEIETRNDQTVVSKTTTGKRMDDGTIELTEQVESMKVSLELPGGIELSFDSSKPVEPQGTAADFLLDLFAAVPKVVSTTQFDKENRVVSVKVDEEPFKDLPENALAIIKGLFDPDYLKKATNKELDRIPVKPLKKGDVWELTQDVRIGQGQSFTITKAYKYEGTIEKEGKQLDKISFAASKVEYAQEAGDSPIKVSDSTLKVESSKGALLFDRALGVIVQENDLLHVTGELTIDANGNELSAKLDLTIETTTTTR